MDAVDISTWLDLHFCGIREDPGVLIPEDDDSAWMVTAPQFLWLFNKMEICRSQGIACYPHGVEPLQFPVFSRPIINLHGLSEGARVLDSWNWKKDYRPGHFWMPVLKGTQYSTDLIIANGQIIWSYTMKAHPKGIGRFSAWSGPEDLSNEIQSAINAWSICLTGYSGILNIEHFDHIIFEAQPRLAPQFLYFYGEEWIKALVEFYKCERWSDFPPGARQAYSIIIPGNRHYTYTFTPGDVGDMELRLCIDFEGYPDTAGRLAVLNGRCPSKVKRTFLKVMSWFKKKEVNLGNEGT